MIYVGQGKTHNTMIPEFGRYQGYSEPVYDSTQRTLDYLTLSDGTRLAYDVIIPTRKGVPADRLLPALLSYTPYGRTWTTFDRNGKFLSDQAPVPAEEPVELGFSLLPTLPVSLRQPHTHHDCLCRRR